MLDLSELGFGAESPGLVEESPLLPDEEPLALLLLLSPLEEPPAALAELSDASLLAEPDLA